jgi:hypothetical protein
MNFPFLGTRWLIMTCYNMEDKIYPHISVSENVQKSFLRRIRVPWEQKSKGTRTLTSLLVNNFYADCDHIWVVLYVAPEKYTSVRDIFRFSDAGKNWKKENFGAMTCLFRILFCSFFPLFKENQLSILISYLSQFFVSNHIISALYIWHS